MLRTVKISGLILQVVPLSNHIKIFVKVLEIIFYLVEHSFQTTCLMNVCVIVLFN
jgi:hypothetical protein